MILRPRQPVRIAVWTMFLAGLAVLVGLLADLYLSRGQELETGKKRLTHLTELIAEHTSRSLEAVDILLRELSTDLSRSPQWEGWSDQTGFEYLSIRHTRSLPQVRDLIIFDRKGNQRFISTQFPASNINVRDRPYFVTLEGGADFAMYGPYIGRNSGRYTYALARRLKDANQGFGGAVFAALEPAYFQDFCWSIRLSDDFEAVLVNTQGRIVASCRPTDLSQQAPLIGANVTDALAGGVLRKLELSGNLTSQHGWLVTEAPVQGFPDLRILTLVPESALLQHWQRRLVDYGTLTLLVLTILFLGGWLLREHTRRLEQQNHKLEGERQGLEQKVLLANQRLEQQKEEAERANAAKSRFLAAASHDLRQPLHALALFASDLQRQIRLNKTEQLPHLAAQVQTSTEVLSELLDSLLDLSRLDVAGIAPQLNNLPIQEVFERLATTFDRAALAKGLQLRFRSNNLMIYSDATLLERLLANLVSNAIRYTERGGVLVSARRRGSQVLVEVRDTGIGIPAEHRQAIFVEFYQINNAARESHKGLGLGLSIVDRLTRALGTRIELESTLGKGTRFGLRVPCGKLDDSDNRPGREQSRQEQQPLLLIQGHCKELDMVATLVTEWGYPVTRTEGPPPQIIIAANPDLPQLATRFPGIPMIALIGDGELALGNAHGLTIPIRPARLRALLRRLAE